jgi:hypothetical protein
MNNVFQALKFPAFLLLIIVTIIACEQDYNSIESDLLPEKTFNTDFFAAPIVSLNKKIDSVRINNLTANLFGFYNDPAYGQTTASIITQVLPTEFNPDFGENTVIDSVVLTIPYYSKIIADSTDTDGNAVYSISDSLFGNQPIKLSIFQNNYFLRDFNPTEILSPAQSYYSNANGNINSEDNFAITETGSINFDAFKGPLIYEVPEFLPSPNAIVLKKTNSDDTETTERIAPAFRDTLSSAFWKSVIIDKEGSNELSNANNFYNYFRGLYFKAEAINADGNMIMLNLGGSGANITIYYSYDSSVAGADPLQDTYVLNFTGNRLNTFINDFTGVTLENGDTTNGDEKLYLKGTEGSIAVVDILSGTVDCDGEEVSALDCFKKEYRAVDENGNYIVKNGDFVLKKLINEAQLIVYEDETMVSPSDDYHKYDRLYAYDVKNNIPIIDYNFDPSGNTSDPFSSKIIHLGQRITDDNGISKFKIRITEHLNNILLKDSTNTKIGLVLSTNVNYVSNASILNSGDEVTGIPAASVITPRGSILYGSNQNVPEDKRMSLKIYFTESKPY